MRLGILSLLFLGLWASMLRPASASFVYTYDFLGSPGSGLAADQTNSQTSNATFSDFTRVGVTESATANVFESYDWSLMSGNTPDPSTYNTFSITAAAGYHLNLSQLTFDQMHGPGGPTKAEVALYLNGSSTPYATFAFNTASSVQTMTFNFIDTTDADNVTTAEFRFYCWNAGGSTSTYTMLFDNVSTTLTIVPEPTTWLASLLPLFLAGHAILVRRRAKTTARCSPR